MMQGLTNLQLHHWNTSAPPSTLDLCGLLPSVDQLYTLDEFSYGFL